MSSQILSRQSINSRNSNSNNLSDTSPHSETFFSTIHSKNSKNNEQLNKAIADLHSDVQNELKMKIGSIDISDDQAQNMIFNQSLSLQSMQKEPTTDDLLEDKQIQSLLKSLKTANSENKESLMQSLHETINKLKSQSTYIPSGSLGQSRSLPTNSSSQLQASLSKSLSRSLPTGISSQSLSRSLPTGTSSQSVSRSLPTGTSSQSLSQPGSLGRSQTTQASSASRHSLASQYGTAQVSNLGKAKNISKILSSIRESLEEQQIEEPDNRSIKSKINIVTSISNELTKKPELATSPEFIKSITSLTSLLPITSSKSKNNNDDNESSITSNKSFLKFLLSYFYD